VARIWWRLQRRRHVGALVAIHVGHSLLLLRSSYRSAWNFPGGSVRQGETPEVSVTRELAEEIGLVANAPLQLVGEVCGVSQRYERSAARRDTRAGHYERGLQTKAGEVRLRVPKLRQQTFETAIIERYRRRESSVEEALIEMYLAGVSVRRVEDITEALWGHAGARKLAGVGQPTSQP